MSQRPDPTPTVKLAAALDGNATLGQLLQRLNDARRRFDAVLPALPEALRPDVRPGPVDDSSWILLAAHNAAASLSANVPSVPSKAFPMATIT